jgi:DNA-binding XRE family transcriptional regulator
MKPANSRPNSRFSGAAAVVDRLIFQQTSPRKLEAVGALLREYATAETEHEKMRAANRLLALVFHRLPKRKLLLLAAIAEDYPGADVDERDSMVRQLIQSLFRRPNDLISEGLAAIQGSGLPTHRLHVANRIRELRLKLHWKQRHLAEASGLTQSHISLIESMAVAPTYITIQKLAKALKARMSDIDPGFDD